ncbi:hypothetical protein WJX74_003972 [Apatococcus lobatus]|uniref:Uncharacterized protein n=1 Tax=Apatococcus lobatus TaxID=904363 RepID=A0AAW1RTT1_9CHLO
MVRRKNRGQQRPDLDQVHNLVVGVSPQQDAVRPFTAALDRAQDCRPQFSDLGEVRMAAAKAVTSQETLELALLQCLMMFSPMASRNRYTKQQVEILQVLLDCPFCQGHSDALPAALAVVAHQLPELLQQAPLESSRAVLKITQMMTSFVHIHPKGKLMLPELA